MARTKSEDVPAFWIIAGPNGFGKSTLYGSRHGAMAAVPRLTPLVLKEADWALLFDNSDQLRIVGRKHAGIVTLDETAPAALTAAVKKAAR
jgi:predicted ABC-type ATPase